jgi:hypothetical protein
VPDPSRRKLAARSERLLAAVAELRALEARKRLETISSPEFRSLAGEVETKSQEIFRLATEQIDLAGDIPTRGDSIDDVVNAVDDGS